MKYISDTVATESFGILLRTEQQATHCYGRQEVARHF